MSPEGLALFKKAILGLAILFAVMFAYSKFSDIKTQVAKEPEPETIKQNPLENGKNEQTNLFSEDEERKVYSAQKELTQRLHFHAYNAFRANRLRNSIQIWETIQFLSPEDPISELRLKQAKDSLNRLVQENINLGAIDYKYLRYNRAIHFWTRAANLVADVDDERYRQIQSYIAMAERRLKQ